MAGDEGSKSVSGLSRPALAIKEPTSLPEACHLVLSPRRRAVVDAAIDAGVFRAWGAEVLGMTAEDHERESARLKPFADAALAALREGLAIIAASPGLKVIGTNTTKEGFR